MSVGSSKFLNKRKEVGDRVEDREVLEDLTSGSDIKHSRGPLLYVSSNFS